MVLTRTNTAPTALCSYTRATSFGSLEQECALVDTSSKKNTKSSCDHEMKKVRRPTKSEQENGEGTKPESVTIGSKGSSSSSSLVHLETPTQTQGRPRGVGGDAEAAASAVPLGQTKRHGSVKELRNLFNRPGGSSSSVTSSPCKDPARRPQFFHHKSPGQLPKSSCSASSFLALPGRSTLLYNKKEDDNNIVLSSSRHKSNNDSPPPARSTTANATFDNLVAASPLRNTSSRRSCSTTSSLTKNSLLSPEVAALQKRLAEFKEKLQQQEARHIQERLTWQGQTMELLRLRKERDRLLEDQTNQRRQLMGTESIAEAVMAENRCLRAKYDDGMSKANDSTNTASLPMIDWEAKLNELRQANASKESKIGALEGQLQETSQHLQRETEINTEVVIQLNEVAGELRRQSSQKDLKIGVLAAQLDEKDQQLQLETDINTQLVAQLRANERELRRQSSQKDVMIERLTAELHGSRGAGKLLVLPDDTECPTTRNDDHQEGLADAKLLMYMEKFQKEHDELKDELEKRKAKDLKTIASLQKKLEGERSKLKKERQDLQVFKRAVVTESIQAISVMSGLRELVEKLQQKIADLQTENATLKNRPCM